MRSLHLMLSVIFVLSAGQSARALPAPAPVPPAPAAQIDEWYCRNQYRILGTNKAALTLAIKQHLTAADKLLLSRQPEDKLKGLGVALAAAACASERVGDSALATNISERYLIPNRRLAPDAAWEYMSKDRIATAIISIYEQAGNNPKIIETCNAWLATYPSGDTSDAIRARLARALLSSNRRGEAITQLKQISDTGSMAGAKAWVPELAGTIKVPTQTVTNGLNSIFSNMAKATGKDIEEEAASEAANESMKYPSVPAKLPLTARFGGGLIPKSDNTKLAIASDSPVKVYINGELTYQSPETNETEETATTNQQNIPATLKEGELYNIQVEYTKTNEENETIGGITLFAYGGGADLIAPRMVSLPPSGNTGIIQLQYQLTFTGPGNGPLPNVSLKEKEDADSIHTCQWIDHGYGARTDQINDGVLTCTWTWNWNTLPVHNGRHTTEYTIHWNSGHTTKDTVGITIGNLSITNSTPRPVVLGSTGTATINTTCAHNNLSNIDTQLGLVPITSIQQLPTVTPDTYNWTLNGSPQSQGIYSYEITISGDASNPLGIPGSYRDTVTYRSQHLTTNIAAVYKGTDENGDNYDITYTIADSNEKDASSGYITIYKPDGTIAQTLSSIDITLGTHTIEFSILNTWSGGRYEAVLTASDDDGPLYRDHLNRWALEKGASMQTSVAMPTFSPDGGAYSTAQTVTMACATSGAEIRYTTDGSDPTTASTLYTEPVTIDHTMTLKARAYKTGWLPSAIKRADYTFTYGTVATPTFDPGSGTYHSVQHVTINCATEGAIIHYTTDGSNPTLLSTLYTGPVTVDHSLTIKAVAWKADWNPSGIGSATYIITLPKTIYVNGSATGTTHDGTSWNTAYLTINDAITDAANYAIAGSSIWVAASTYQEQITLVPGTSIHGGFAGTEEQLTQRDWQTNPTILNGNYEAGSVVTCPSEAGQDTIISGLIIENGAGTTGEGTNTYGGGIYCAAGAAPIIANNTVRTNNASHGGGIYCKSGSSPTIINNNIAGNTADMDGGGIHIENQAAPTIINNTIIGCKTAGEGGGIYAAAGSTPTIGNSIVLNNTPGIYIGTGATPTLSNNCVWGNTSYNYSGIDDPTSTDGNISVDPALVNPGQWDGTDWIDGDYHLQTTSPCINAGDDQIVQSGWTDIDGQTRINDTHVDIGTDEIYIVATPIINPAGGTYNTVQNATITCATAGAEIRYTTDGSDPTASSTLYTGPVTIDHDVTLKAMAFKPKWAASAVTDMSYVVDTTAPAPGTATSPQSTDSSPIAVSYEGAADNQGGSGLKKVELWYRKDPGSWTNTGQSSTTGSGSFDFAPSGSGIYYFALVAEDNAGNRSPAPAGGGDCQTLYSISTCSFVYILIPQ